MVVGDDRALRRAGHLDGHGLVLSLRAVEEIVADVHVVVTLDGGPLRRVLLVGIGLCRAPRVAEIAERHVCSGRERRAGALIIYVSESGDAGASATGRIIAHAAVAAELEAVDRHIGSVDGDGAGDARLLRGTLAAPAVAPGVGADELHVGLVDCERADGVRGEVDLGILPVNAQGAPYSGEGGLTRHELHITVFDLGAGGNIGLGPHKIVLGGETHAPGQEGSDSHSHRHTLEKIHICLGFD